MAAPTAAEFTQARQENHAKDLVEALHISHARQHNHHADMHIAHELHDIHDMEMRGTLPVYGLFPEIEGAGGSTGNGMFSKHLGEHDVVGVTFFVAQNIMLAFTFFFFLERSSVPAKWQTSMTVAGMVTGIATFNYGFMRDTWVEMQSSPTCFRYTDWLVTVPLLIVEFYCVLKATTRCDESVFWRLMTASIVMLATGYMGELGLAGSALAFCISFSSYLYIVYEIFSGECSKLSIASNNKAGMKCYNTLRFLLSVCWLIYPVGYLLRGTSYEGVNITYNLADIVNKGFFGLAIWAAAKEEQK